MEDMELGTLLKKARQEKELTLDDIQERTKIRKKYLEAIEENNFDILPGKVYLKVFVKGYAREVDINYKELLNYYPVLTIKKENGSNLHKDYLGGTEVSHKSNKKNDNNKNPFKIIFILFISLFLIAAGVYAYQYFSNSEIRLLNQNTAENQEQLNEQSEILEVEEENNNAEAIDEMEKQSSDQSDSSGDNILNSIDSGILSEQNTEFINQNNFDNIEGMDSAESDRITEIIVSEDLTDNQDIINENSEDNTDQIDISENEDSGAVDLQSEDVGEDLTANEVTAENNESAEENTQINSDEMEDDTVRFIADDTVWVTVDLDGENAFSGILEAGDNREFEIENQLYIKIGNSAAVTAVINGEQYGPWTESGGIAEVEFVIEDNEVIINNLRQ